MFENDLFDIWLDNKSKEIVLKLDKEKLSSDEMMVLMLKAQTNHFAHLDQDLRQEMIDLRSDMDKRFEQVDKRFEQVDKRFEALATRIDRFMIWSFATTITAGGIVIASIKFID